MNMLDTDQVVQKLKGATGHWAVEDQERLTRAIIFARTKHARQTYAPASEYAIHPLRAALTLVELGNVEPDVVLATVLHDTIEDTATTEEELRGQFGERVTTLVKLVSYPFTAEHTVHEKIEMKADVLAQIRRGPIEVRQLKCVDLLDQMRNWRLLPKGSNYRAKLLRFLEQAQAYALPLAEETDERLAVMMRHELEWFYVHAV